MQSIITNPAPKEVEGSYPCLKVFKSNKNLIVLFTGKNTGMVVSPSERYLIGEYLDDWFELAFFEDFSGEVTLKN